jgi:hypothetical protein
VDLDFKEVLSLINRTGSVEINLTPDAAEGGRWAIFAGHVSVGADRIPYGILYLMPGLSSRDELAHARRALLARNDLQIRQLVYADSLVDESRFPAVASGASDEGIRRLGVREFFLSFARQQLNEYVSQLKLKHPLFHYISPDLRREGHGATNASNFLWSSLMGADAGPRDEGGISVLLAEPGQGKTYYATYLALRLAASKKIPLLVTSDQWQTMAQSDFASLWKTALHALRWHNAPITWADGAEEDFLRVAQKSGAFAIIFDGFDEFVLRAGGETSALDALAKFRDLAAESESEVLLTSRTAFWSSEVADQFEPLLGHRVRGDIYYLKPFDRKHADEYFAQRFPDTPMLARQAISVFESLKRDGNGDRLHLVGRGLFLHLVADLVAGSLSEFALERSDTPQLNPLSWICEKLCDRESTRQKLGIPWSVQFQILEELAEETARGHGVSTQVIGLLLQGYAQVEEARLEPLIGNDGRRRGKLAYHPLLRQSERDWRWEFSQEQLFYYFLSRRMLSQIAADQRIALGGFFSRIGSGKKLQFELATMLNEIGSEGIYFNEGLEALIQRLILLECDLAPGADSLLRSTIGASMAIQTINRELPAGHSRKERSDRLLSILGSNEVRNLGFADSLTNFDFGGVHFDNCSFESISIIGCRFDARTTFRRCVFAGITVLKSESLSLASIDASCSVDPEFRRQLVNELGARKGVHKYTVHDLKVDFETALRRITPNELPAAGSISEAYINRGRLAGSPFQKKIMAVLKRHVVEPAPAATSHLAIRPDVVPALHFFRANGVLSGPLAIAWEELSQPLSEG